MIGQSSYCETERGYEMRVRVRDRARLQGRRRLRGGAPGPGRARVPDGGHDGSAARRSTQATAPRAASRRPALLTAGLAAIVALLAGWPQLAGAQRIIGAAHLVSFRVPVLIVAACVLAIVLIGMVLRRSWLRRLWPLALVLLVFTVSSGVTVTSRGLSAGEVPAASAPEDVRVLSWNTRGDEPGSPTIAELAIAMSADVVALPETTEEMGVEIATIMADAGMPMWVHTRTSNPDYKATSTTLLISPRLGDYEVVEDQGDTAILPTVIARSLEGGPTIIAAHAVSPTPVNMDEWDADLRWLADRCEGNTIMAGDFNATADHMAGLERNRTEDFHAVLGSCADAALTMGSGSLGTWTAGLAPYLGTQIDHVLASDAWRASAFELVESENRSGSDHRPVFAVLSPAA